MSRRLLLSRRTFLTHAGATLAAACALPLARLLRPAQAFARGAALDATVPTRVLGRTGVRVTQMGLGGEGVLRTWGRDREAAAVITRALDLGITYCDTAPAYSGSQDYYGAVLGERRNDIFLASKTHDRTRDGSLTLLEHILKQLRTDHLDLWQLHDLRDQHDLDQVFEPKRGALAALRLAREEGRVRYLGITGHYDPAILLEAMRRFDFDTVLVALNAADKARLSFIDAVLPEARRRHLGVIGMKVVGRGALLKPQGPLTAAQAMHYVLSLAGVSTAIIGCRTPEEVEENVRIAIAYQELSADIMQAIEISSVADSRIVTSYKKST